MLRPVVGARFQVLFHSPYRGAFHLSLTVLVHYRSSIVFSLGRWTSQIPTGFHVPRRTQEHRRSLSDFAYGTVTLYGPTFLKVLLPDRFVTPMRESYNPAAIKTTVWAFPLSLATT